MSRRRNARPHRLHVEVEFRCANCDASIGSAFQYRDQHPRSGESVVDARAGRLVDRPQGGQKLLAHCSACGARPQRLWSDIVSHLDRLDHRDSWRQVQRL
jgi:hypothetical protein